MRRQLAATTPSPFIDDENEMFIGADFFKIFNETLVFLSSAKSSDCLPRDESPVTVSSSPKVEPAMLAPCPTMILPSHPNSDDPEDGEETGEEVDIDGSERQSSRWKQGPIGQQLSMCWKRSSFSMRKPA